jgi:predicted nuclease of restriction endonuclease-like RecB superfamily
MLYTRSRLMVQEFIESRRTLKRLRKLKGENAEITATKVRSLGGRGSVYQYTKTGARADLGGLIVRSNWEANVARVFTIHGIKFEFEPTKFYFPIKRGTKVYIPDFYLPATDEYIEVKGFFDDKSRIKIKRFKKYFPDEFERLIMIISKSSSRAKKIATDLGVKTVLYYEDFKVYKPIISTWEGQ